MSALTTLVEQGLWANRKWVEFVYSREDEDAVAKELLGHIAIGERIWFDRVEGATNPIELFPKFEKQALLELFASNNAVYQRLIDSCLEDLVQFKRISGEVGSVKVSDVIIHLTTHGFHHRGQLSSHYARKGVEFPQHDHIFFMLAEGK